MLAQQKITWLATKFSRLPNEAELEQYDALSSKEIALSINQIQFQKGLSMAYFMDRYGTQEKCREQTTATCCAILQATKLPLTH